MSLMEDMSKVRKSEVGRRQEKKKRVVGGCGLIVESFVDAS